MASKAEGDVTGLRRNLKDMIPSTGLTLARVAQILRGMPGFLDMADVYGPNKTGRIASFLKLYPDMFELQTGAAGGVSKVRLKARSSSG